MASQVALNHTPGIRQISANDQRPPITIPEREEILPPRTLQPMKPTSNMQQNNSGLQISEEQMRQAIKTQEQSRLAQNSLLSQRQNTNHPPQIPNQMERHIHNQPQAQRQVPLQRQVPPHILQQQMQLQQMQQLQQLKQAQMNNIAKPLQTPHQAIVEPEKKLGFFQTIKNDIKFPLVVFLLVVVLTYPSLTKIFGNYIPGMTNLDNELTLVGVLTRAVFITVLIFAAKYLVK